MPPRQIVLALGDKYFTGPGQLLLYLDLDHVNWFSVRMRTRALARRGRQPFPCVCLALRIRYCPHSCEASHDASVAGRLAGRESGSPSPPMPPPITSTGACLSFAAPETDDRTRLIPPCWYRSCYRRRRSDINKT